jgi:predicted ester cyclase
MSSPEPNKATVRRYFEEVYNEPKDALIHELFHPEFTDYAHLEGTGALRAKHVVDFERSAFPDIHFTVEDMLAEDDGVIVRLTIRGTHGGTFLGIAPSGKRAEFIGIQRMRFDEGKIREVIWHHYDKLTMLHQLGAPNLPDRLLDSPTKSRYAYCKFNNSNNVDPEKYTSKRCSESRR